jgi:hypothetical protein
MTINTPYGLLRLEPLRWLNRLWTWLDCPPECKRIVWSNVEQRNLAIRSFTDGEILSILFGPYGGPPGESAYRLEAVRRGLPVERAPLWVQAVRDVYPNGDRMKIAERLFRPYGA